VTESTAWAVVLLCGLGCFALKFAGHSMPQRWFAAPRVRAAIEIMPVALLAALIVVQSIADGRHYDPDAARLAGVAVGGVAVWRRAPFMVVLVLAAATAALLRLA